MLDSDEEAITRIRALRFKDDSLATLGVSSGPRSEARLRDVRERNLTKALRLCPEISPQLSHAVEDVRSKLVPHLEVEVYLHNDPLCRAFSFVGLPGRSIVISITSGLVRLVSLEELKFVLGHEVGHALFGHEAYPEDAGQERSVEHLNLLVLSRAAEISADRVGFIACRSSRDAYQAILKTVSGLPDELIRFDLSAYLDQGRELCTMGGSGYELMSTHPMFSVRMRALLWFEMSELYFDWQRKSGHPPIDAISLQKKIRQELAAASGFRLAELNEEAVKSALLWGMLCVFSIDGKLSKPEQALLTRTFGESAAEDAIGFVRQSGPDAVKARLEEKLAGISRMPHEVKHGLCDDLERFASMAGGAEDMRRAWMEGVVRILGLSRDVSMNITEDDPSCDLRSESVFRSS